MKFFKQFLNHLANLDCSLTQVANKLEKLDRLEYLDDYIKDKSKVTVGSGLSFMYNDGVGEISIDGWNFDCFTGQIIDRDSKNATKVLILNGSSVETRYTLSPPKTFPKKGWMWDGKTLVITREVADELVVSQRD